MIIVNGLVFTDRFVFEKKNLRVLKGIITEVTDAELSPEDGEEVVDAAGKRIIPGLTDIHFHGAVGVDLCDGTPEAVRKLAEYEYSAGVTQICPATMTLPVDRVEKIVKNAYEFKKEQEKKALDNQGEYAEKESRLVGINLEGPFISPQKVGAQNPEYVVAADAEFLGKLLDETESLPKVITIAPEEQGNITCIEKLHDRIRFSIGHTNAGYEEARAGFEAGAKHMTHLFNAMNGINHRLPGPIVAGAERSDVTPELISDGIHVAPASVRFAFDLFGADRMILISDSTRAAGMADGEYELGGQPVFKYDNAAWLTKKEPGKQGTLAGSASNLFECLQKAIEFGVPAEDAIRAATYNPAAAIGVSDKYGTIARGKSGRLLMLDDNYDLVRVL